MLRNVEVLIGESRQSTENTEFTDDTGIGDDECLIYLNDAQKSIHAAIVRQHSDVFLVEKEIDAAPRLEAYDLPGDMFLGASIDGVEYSQSGLERDYYQLDQGVKRERAPGTSGGPSVYIRKGSKLLLSPAPSQPGKIRVSYNRRVPRLDKRRGQVLSVDMDAATRTITSLMLDPSIAIAEDLAREGYITVVDKDGNIQMKAIPIASVNVASGEITLDGAFTYEEGESIAVGSYVCIGKWATTHAHLDEICEPFLKGWLDYKMLWRDSSSSSVEQSAEIVAIRNEILEAYGEADQDVDSVPILDGDVLGEGI